MNAFVLFIILFVVSLPLYYVIFHFSAKMADIRKTRTRLVEKKLFARMPLVAIASLMERKEYTKALEKIEEMQGTDPLNPTLHHLKINCYYKLGKFERSLSLCEDALDVLFKTDPSFAAKKAEILLELGRHQDAEALLQHWLEDHPDHPRLLIVKARLDINQGRREQGRAMLKGVLRKDMSLELAIRSVKEFQDGGLLENVKKEIAAEREA